MDDIVAATAAVAIGGSSITLHTHTLCVRAFTCVWVCVLRIQYAPLLFMDFDFSWTKLDFCQCFVLISVLTLLTSLYLSLSLSVYFYLYSKHHLPIRTGVCLLLIFSWHRPSFLIIKSCTKHNDQMSAGGHEHGRKENLLDMEMQGWNPPFFLKKKKKKTFCKMYAKRTESFSHFAAENIVGVFDWPSRVRSIVCVCALWRQQPVPW